MKNNIMPMPARRVEKERTYPVLSLKKIHDMVKKQCGHVRILKKYGSGKDKVIILPEAFEELKMMVSYGRRSPMNVNEQKYVGYGHYIFTEKNNIVVIVKHFIEIQTMNRSRTNASNLGPNGENNPGLDFLEYHREEFFRNESRFNKDAYGYDVDPFLNLCGKSEFVLEGHTHPDLGTFFSGPDRTSGAARAASAPVCIFVCDPIRKEMLGNIGSDFNNNTEVVVYERGEEEISSLGNSDEDIINKSDEEIESISDRIAFLTSGCLRTKGYSGNIKIRTRLDGHSVMKINLVIPKTKGHVR